ncbi:MAG: hypothetical protein ACRCYU_17915 [Nocardioides sp.]
MLDDLVLDQQDWQVWQVALAALSASAEEVGVGATVAFGFGVDESADASSLVAAVAVEHPFEVVLEDAFAFAGLGAEVEDVLHPVE